MSKTTRRAPLSMNIIQAGDAAPTGKLADAELLFTRAARGLKLTGFAVWSRKDGGHHVTVRRGPTSPTARRSPSRSSARWRTAMPSPGAHAHHRGLQGATRRRRRRRVVARGPAASPPGRGGTSPSCAPSRPAAALLSWSRWPAKLPTRSTRDPRGRTRTRPSRTTAKTTRRTSSTTSSSIQTCRTRAMGRNCPTETGSALSFPRTPARQRASTASLPPIICVPQSGHCGVELALMVHAPGERRTPVLPDGADHEEQFEAVLRELLVLEQMFVAASQVRDGPAFPPTRPPRSSTASPSATATSGASCAP